MLVFSHMYYSKTFVAGQFSPDYWEVKLYDVLEAHDIGKVIQVDNFTAQTGLNSAVHIDILDLDDLSLSNELYANTLSVFGFKDVPYTTNLDSIRLSVLDTKAESYNTAAILDYIPLSTFVGITAQIDKDSYQSKFLSSFLSTENSLDKDSYLYSGISTAIVNDFALDSTFSSTQVSVIEPANLTVGKSNLGVGIKDLLRDNHKEFKIALGLSHVAAESFIYMSSKIEANLICSYEILGTEVVAGVFKKQTLELSQNFL